MVDRTDRLAEEVKKEISNIIHNTLKDPRLPSLVSVLKVNLAKDLRYAKVFVSVLGNDAEKENCLKALKSAAGFIRREVGHNINIRYSPELTFVMDDSIERGIYLARLIDKTILEDNKAGDNERNLQS